MHKKLIAAIGLVLFIFGIISRNNIARAENAELRHEFLCSGIRGTIRLSESIIKLGDPITVNTRFKNVTAETLIIRELRVDNYYDLNDYLEWAQEPQDSFLRLQPGEEIEITFTRSTKTSGNFLYRLDVDDPDSADPCTLGLINIFVIYTFGLSISSFKLVSSGSLIIGLLILLFTVPELIFTVYRLLKESSAFKWFLPNGQPIIAMLIAFVAGQILSVITGISLPGCGYIIFFCGLSYVVAFVMGVVHIKIFVPKLGRARAIMIGVMVATILGFIEGSITGWPMSC